MQILDLMKYPPSIKNFDWCISMIFYQKREARLRYMDNESSLNPI